MQCFQTKIEFLISKCSKEQIRYELHTTPRVWVCPCLQNGTKLSAFSILFYFSGTDTIFPIHFVLFLILQNSYRNCTKTSLLEWKWYCSCGMSFNFQCDNNLKKIYFLNIFILKIWTQDTLRETSLIHMLTAF